MDNTRVALRISDYPGDLHERSPARGPIRPLQAVAAPQAARPDERSDGQESQVAEQIRIPPELMRVRMPRLVVTKLLETDRRRQHRVQLPPIGPAGTEAELPSRHRVQLPPLGQPQKQNSQAEAQDSVTVLKPLHALLLAHRPGHRSPPGRGRRLTGPHPSSSNSSSSNTSRLARPGVHPGTDGPPLVTVLKMKRKNRQPAPLSSRRKVDRTISAANRVP